MYRATYRLTLVWIIGLSGIDAKSGRCTAQTPTEQFSQLVDESWEFDLRESPVWATDVGDHRYNDQLPHVTVGDVGRRLAKKREFSTRLTAIDPKELSEADQVNYKIFRRLLEDEIAEAELKTYLIPITNRSGFHISFPELRQRVPLNTVADFQNYIQRLRAFDRYAAEHIDLMREGIAAGQTLPNVVLDGYDKSIQPHIVKDPESSLLFEPFKKIPQTISETARQRILQQGREAIDRSVVPGYQKFLEFMEKEYVPSARTSIGASALPNGRDLYRHRVRRFTTLDVTPESVRQVGLDEVRRIRSEMEQIIRKTNFEGDFAAFVEFLRSDDQFYAETPEQLMKEVALVLKKMDGKLPELFKTLPRSPYGIRRVPDYVAPLTTTAYYMRPAGDGTRAGFYYVNTYDLRSRPLYGIEALSLHEAVPGHHLQIALQQELTGLPKFRQYAGFTVFVEGWALYAERLGLEVDFYQDPYRDFGRLTYEMWRACRLVVDTGIHYFGWTRSQALRYMEENTALTKHNIRAEVDRYIAWPGQALAYKTGELKIRELRKLAEHKLGQRFDIREFHDVVLGAGAVPLNVLEDRVMEYVNSQLETSQ